MYTPLQWWAFEEHLIKETAADMKRMIKRRLDIAEQLGIDHKKLLNMDSRKLFYLGRKFMFSRWYKWRWGKWFYEENLDHNQN